MAAKRVNPTDGIVFKAFIESGKAREFDEIADSEDRSRAYVLRRLIHAFVENPELRRLVREHVEASQDPQRPAGYRSSGSPVKLG